MNIYLATAGVIGFRCKFSVTPTCDTPFGFLSMIYELILLIPYSFIGILLFNHTNMIRNVYKEHGILFCFSNMICSMCFSFSSFTILTIQASTIYILTNAIRIFQIYTFVIYFNDIAKILMIFNVYGSKIIYYLSKLLQYILICTGIVRYISFYITIPYISEFIDLIYYEKSGLFYLVVIIYVLSFIMLVMTFIFSNLKEMLESGKRSKLQIAIFFIPLILMMYILLFTWLNSRYYQSLFPIYINSFKTTKQFLTYHGILFYNATWFPTMNLAPLVILFLLSSTTKITEEITIKTDDVFNENLQMEI